MSSFQGGPADGVALFFERVPVYLRVVRKTITGEFDVLDQLEDEPEPGEEVHVYRRVGVVGHVCTRGSGGRCYPVATYEHVEVDAVALELHDTEAWRAWCRTRDEAA